MKKNITIEQMSTKDKYDYLIGMIESYMDEDANVVSTEQLLEALLIDLINKYPVFSLTDSSVNFYKYPKEFQEGNTDIKAKKYYKEVETEKELPRADGYYRSNNEPSFYNVIEDQWYNQRGEQIAVKYWLKEITIADMMEIIEQID